MLISFLEYLLKLGTKKFSNTITDMNVFLPSTAFAFSYLEKKLFSKNIWLQAELRIVLCYLMASHCNPMAFNLHIPSFIAAFFEGSPEGCALCFHAV